ncbi:hypothetical protein AXE85_05720 [Gemella sp. oral taxon 928]|uniref:Dna2/Cas4 domain-containing protein n=1 Tax=Gemella sp. oral taxon 928 TaxID=1785995 RepID=UPI0007680F08|nr:Dna2/Cas4 domain-containing protein [Gemella sp. oral taxon 928]AME09684.1 hypothetical protein AXE85_05720 [Gemella sp. oral taxon 928]
MLTSDYNFKFDELTHTYYLNDKEILSVTQCIKLLLGEMYDNIPYSILKQASDYGTRIHFLIESLEDGIEWETRNVYEKNAIRQYEKIKDFETLEKEKFVSYENVYCGRVDGIGNNIIYDIKTTSKVNEEYLKYQLSLYLIAYDKTNYDNYKGYVLWLPKKGTGKKIEIKLFSKDEILEIIEKIKELTIYD